jgi:serine/threonine protein kinase
MKYGEHNIAYAILEKADFDMKQLFDNNDKTIVKPRVDLSTFKKLYKDVYTALQCIHTNYFVHSDIKPANVGIVVENDKTIRPILFDFGMAVPIGSEQCKLMTFGTREYIPYNFKKECRIQTDLYAYGFMLFKHLFTVNNVNIDSTNNSWFYDINHVTCNKGQLHTDFSQLFTCNTLEHNNVSVNLSQSKLYEDLYKIVRHEHVEIDPELQSSKKFIISLLNCVNKPNESIDTSWLDNTTSQDSEDSNTSTIVDDEGSYLQDSQYSTLKKEDSSNTSLSQSIASSVDSALKSKLSTDDSSTGMIQKTNLSQTIAAAVESALKSESEIDVKNILKSSSESTMKFLSESSTDKSLDKEKTDGVVDVTIMIPPPADSSISGLSVTINTPEQASGFLLVCPSSKQVVGILNIDNSNSINQICSFLYDKNFSTNRTFSQPFLSSDLNVCISEFINTIDGIINKTMECYTTPSNSVIKQSPAIVESNTLSSLFANAFIRVIT